MAAKKSRKTAKKQVMARLVITQPSTSTPVEEPERVEYSLASLLAMLERATTTPLSAAEGEVLKQLLESYALLICELELKQASIKRLKTLVFGATTESLAKLKKSLGNSTPEPEDKDKKEPRKRKGHGRRKADDLPGAKRIAVPHPTLNAGTHCPGCETGRVYPFKAPAKLVRFRAVAPIEATLYEQQRLRCNCCGELFTAPAPEGVKSEKYDESVTAMVAMLRYGAGLPFHRVEKLTQHWGVSLPATTLWMLVRNEEDTLQPVLSALQSQAANGGLLYNDDTSMRVLERDDLVDPPGAKPGERTQIYTSGILSVAGEHKVALFYTGLKHAGENLAELLQRRDSGLEPPIQMCDALAANTKGSFKTLLGNCLAHGRRQLVEVAHNFPEECLYILERLATVYHHDDIAREKQLSPEARLALHQTQSGPLLLEISAYMESQFMRRQVEPNSTLGKAFQYLQRHWEPLTLFLRVPGAPLDSNAVERALKKAILHRKASMFYKTATGARVGDLYMSLIHTAELNGANPFDYLLTLLQNPRAVWEDPSSWLPWNYRQALDHTAAA